LAAAIPIAIDEIRERQDVHHCVDDFVFGTLLLLAVSALSIKGPG
jgi:hypothetical protein